jgi:hypothetical protein
MRLLAIRVFLGLSLACLALLLTAGCASTQTNENRSERPWNTPKNWETGLPMGVGDERR